MPAIWTNPATAPWATGYTVLATDFDTYIRNLFLTLGGTTGHIGARVYHSTTVSVANLTATYLPFDSERYDTDPNGELHSTSSSNSRLTCQTAGKYLITCTIGYAPNANGERRVTLVVNRSVQIAMERRLNVGASIDGGITCTTIWDMNPGDYVEVQFYQDSGGALLIDQSAANSAEFMMARC